MQNPSAGPGRPSFQGPGTPMRFNAPNYPVRVSACYMHLKLVGVPLHPVLSSKESGGSFVLVLHSNKSFYEPFPIFFSVRATIPIKLVVLEVLVEFQAVQP